MIKGFIQRYTIAGLLAIISANALYSAYLYQKRISANRDRDTAIEQRQTAINETADARAERDTIQKSLELTRSELDAARSAIQTREAEIEKIKAAKEASDEKLKKALDGSPDWSAISVPDSVRDALR